MLWFFQHIVENLLLLLTAFSRDDYDAHMKKTHFTHKCHLCIYWSRSPGRLNHHMKKFHSEPGDAPAIKKPKNPRKYTCKQCKYYTYVQVNEFTYESLILFSLLLMCDMLDAAGQVEMDWGREAVRNFRGCRCAESIGKS